MKYRAEIGVKNGGKTDIRVIVESWAEEFLLPAGEDLKVVATSNKETPYFYLIHHSDAVQIYLENADSFEVHQRGEIF